MRVLVCGGREFSNTKLAYSVLDNLHKQQPVGVLIEGDARGADRIAGYWARRNRVDNLKFHANWEKHGKKAGYLRNKQMLEEGGPDLVIAFPGGKGTAMMIELAQKAGVPTRIIKDE